MKITKREREGNMRALFLGLSVAILVFPAQSGAEMVWVDANGRTIGPFLGGWYGTYIDDAGLQWHVDRETATLYVVNCDTFTNLTIGGSRAFAPTG